MVQYQAWCSSTLDLVDTFHKLCLCPTDNNQQEESSPDGRRKSQKNPKIQITN